MFSLRRGQIFLLLESTLQFVDLRWEKRARHALSPWKDRRYHLLPKQIVRKMNGIKIHLPELGWIKLSVFVFEWAGIAWQPPLHFACLSSAPISDLHQPRQRRSCSRPLSSLDYWLQKKNILLKLGRMHRCLDKNDITFSGRPVQVASVSQVGILMCCLLLPSQVTGMLFKQGVIFE